MQNTFLITILVTNICADNIIDQECRSANSHLAPLTQSRSEGEKRKTGVFSFTLHRKAICGQDKTPDVCKHLTQNLK